MFAQFYKTVCNCHFEPQARNLSSYLAQECKISRWCLEMTNSAIAHFEQPFSPLIRISLKL